MDEHVIGIIVRMRDEFSNMLNKFQNAVSRTMSSVDREFSSSSGMDQFNRKVESMRREVRALEGELALLSKIKANPEVNIETAKARADLRELAMELHAFEAANRNVSLSNKKTEKSFADTARQGTAFGRILSGLAILVGPLTTALGGLAGGLTAVALAAGAAAASLGGVLAAAIAQLGPLVASVMTVFSRLKLIGEAIAAQDQQAKSAADDRTAALDRQRAAAQNLIRAQEQLRDAYLNLANARRESKRQLEDLVSAERRASLGSIGSQRALRSAIRSGDVLGTASAQVDASDANRAFSRAQEDTDRARGPEGMRQVEQAQRALRDATWALADAQREASRAATDQSSANSTLADALAKLSPAEKRLMEAFKRLRDNFREMAKEMSTPVIDAFTVTVERIDKIIAGAAFKNSWKALFESMAQSIEIVSKAFSNQRNQENFALITKDLAGNLPIAARAMAAFGEAFGNIAVAAGPSLTRMLESLAGFFESLADTTSDRKKMLDFFDEMYTYLSSFGQLVKATLGLLVALFKAGGGEEGKGIVDDLTGAIQRFTEWINNNKDTVRKFFEDSRAILGVMGNVIVEIVQQLGKLINVESFKNLGIIVTQVIVPALGTFTQMVQDVISVVARLLSLPIVREFARYAISIGLMAFAVDKGIRAFKNMGNVFDNVMNMLDKSMKRTIIGIVIATLIYLEYRWGVVSKAIEFMWGVLQTVFEWIKSNWPLLLAILVGPVGLAIKAIIDHWDGIKDFFSGLFDTVADLFTGFWDNLVTIAKDGVGLVKGVFVTLKDSFIDVGKQIIKWAYTPLYYAYQGIRTAASVVPGVDKDDLTDIPSPDELIGESSNRALQTGPDVLGAAQGAYIPAQPNGRIIRVAEGGYDEAIISTDPKHRRRTMGLIGKVMQSFETGGEVESFNAFFKRVTGFGVKNRASRYLIPYARQFYVADRQTKESPAVVSSSPAVASSSSGPAFSEIGASGLANPFPGGSWAGSPADHGKRALGDWQSDNAWDIMGSAGSKVYAVAGGTVPRITPPGKGPQFAGYGVYLSTDKFGTWWYRHISPAVRVGQKVAAGQLIGTLVPETAGGPHLHLARDRGDPAIARMAMGGELAGQEGAPVPVIAHAGEMILNRAQQWMLGGPSRLRNMFGFKPGGKSSFATGGEIAQINKLFSAIGGLRATGKNRSVDFEGFQYYFTKFSDMLAEAFEQLKQTFSELADGAARLQDIDRAAIELASNQEVFARNEEIALRSYRNAQGQLRAARKSGNRQAIEQATENVQLAATAVAGARALLRESAAARADLVSRRYDSEAGRIDAASNLASQTRIGGSYSFVSQQNDLRLRRRKDIADLLTQEEAKTGRNRNNPLINALGAQLQSLDDEIALGGVNALNAQRSDADAFFSSRTSANDVAMRIAQISGTGFSPNRTAIMDLLRQRGGILDVRGRDLESLLGEAQLQGNERAADELRIAIEENKLAVLENNKQLAEVSGSLNKPQSFSSSAWNMFRMAIFNGSGGLLPQFQIPQMATGGDITKEGIFYLHAGERVIPAGGAGGDTIVNVYEAGQPTNANEIAELVAFKRKWRQ